MTNLFLTHPPALGQRVGREHMYDYATRYGFGQKTGLPVPAESSGKLRKLDRWGTTSLASGEPCWVD